MIKSVALETASGGNVSGAPTGADRRERVSIGKADALCAIALCILTLLSWIPRWNGPLDYRWDAGTYYILGTSLAEGKGYRLLNEPGEIRADQYPPLLPLIVAAHEKLVSSSDIVRVGIPLRRTWILLSLLYVCGAFFLARIFFSRMYSFWLAIICMLSYPMFFLSTLCFAELPFGVATVFFTWSYLRKNGRSWTRYLTPVFAIAGYLLRSMGIALLAAWVADALFRRHFRTAAIRALVALTPVVAWLSYVHSVESAPDYKRPYYAYQRDPSMFYNVSYTVNMQLKDPFKPDLGKATLRDLVSRFTWNAIAMPGTLGESISAREGFFETHVRTINRVLKKHVVPDWPFKVLLYCLGLLVLLGVLNLALKRQWLIASAILLTVAAVCSTPWPGQFARYLSPILPLLLLAFLTAFEGLPETAIRVLPRLITRNLQLIRITMMAFVVCESCIALQSGLRNFLSATHYKDASGRERSYNIMHSSGQYADTEHILEWLGPRADPRSVIAVTMPQWVYIRSGFKSIMPPLNTNADKVQKLVDTVPVSFVIVEELLMGDNFNTYFPKVVENSPDRWKLVYSKQGTPVKLYARVGVASLSGKVVTK